MADLTPTQRRRLLDALKASPLFDTREGRDLLLRDLPAALVDGIARNNIKTVDLDNIVEAARRWGPLPDGTPTLLALLDNARYHTDTSSAGQALEALYQELTVQVTPPESSPTTDAVKRRPPRLTPFEKAERFREVKEAVAAHRWDYALERAKRIRDYPGVRKLIFEANIGYGRQHERLVAFRKAYIQDDWAEVIRIAYQLDPDEPPEVAPIVARAWHEIPIEVRVFTVHSGPVLGLAMTPDGRQILSGSEDGTLRLWDLTTGQIIHTFVNNPQGVWAVTVTPDGRQALSGAENGALVLWDLATGHKVRAFEGHPEGVWAVAVTPDGRQALSGADDGTLKLWDLSTGDSIRTFAGHKGQVYTVAVEPSGRQALSGSSDGTLRQWNLVTGQIVCTFINQTRKVLSVAVTVDGRQALASSNDGMLWLWDLVTSQIVCTFAGHTSWVPAVAVTADGRYALSGSRDQTLRLWDLPTGQELRVLTVHEGGILSIAITPDGRTIASGGSDGTVRLWTLPEGLLG